MYCFGIDIGGTQIKVGLFTEDGLLLDSNIIQTNPNGELILLDITALLEIMIEKRNITKQEVVGVGVGVPAPITVDGFVEHAANLKWSHKNIKDELRELTQLPVFTGNDANLAALGEIWKGGGLGFSNAVFVTLGTGVGGGIVVNQKVITGSNGFGGEIGHMCVNLNESEVCGCGRRGCLEQYSSATGLVRIAKKKFYEMNKNTQLDPNNISAKNIFDLAKYGDFIAEAAVEEFSRYLGFALANIAVLVDPEVFIIGGGVSRAGQIIIDSVQYYYNQNALFANKNVQFRLATLGNEAGMYGAAKIVLS